MAHGMPLSEPALNKTLELRKQGDYDRASPRADDVRVALRDAEASVAAISALLDRDDV
jgi:hypothetical protein